MLRCSFYEKFLRLPYIKQSLCKLEVITLHKKIHIKASNFNIHIYNYYHYFIEKRGHSMNQDIGKKVMVFGIVALFTGLTLVPITCSQVTNNDTTYKLVIITPMRFGRTLKPLANSAYMAPAMSELAIN